MAKRVPKKVEIRVFVEPEVANCVDRLIGRFGSTRSEVVRAILVRYFEAELKEVK